MELAHILRALWARKLLAGLVMLVAVGSAAAIKLGKHSVPTGTASVQILVDSPHSAIADLRQDPTPLTARASVIAQLMSSSLIEQKIASAAGIPAGQLTTKGPFSGPGLALDVVTPSDARGAQLRAEKILYRLAFLPQQLLPIVTVSAQAPTPASAAKLAAAVFPAVSGYIDSLQSAPAPAQAAGGSSAAAGKSTGAAASVIPVQDRVTLRQLGPVQAGAQNSGSALVLGMAAFLGLIVVGFLGIVGLEAVRPKGGASRPRTATVLSDNVPTLSSSFLRHSAVRDRVTVDPSKPMPEQTAPDVDGASPPTIRPAPDYDEAAEAAGPYAERTGANGNSNHGRAQDARTTSGKSWRVRAGS